MKCITSIELRFKVPTERHIFETDSHPNKGSSLFHISPKVHPNRSSVAVGGVRIHLHLRKGGGQNMSKYMGKTPI